MPGAHHTHHRPSSSPRRRDVAQHLERRTTANSAHSHRQPHCLPFCLRDFIIMSTPLANVSTGHSTRSSWSRSSVVAGFAGVPTKEHNPGRPASEVKQRDQAGSEALDEVSLSPFSTELSTERTVTARDGFAPVTAGWVQTQTPSPTSLFANSQPSSGLDFTFFAVWLLSLSLSSSLCMGAVSKSVEDYFNLERLMMAVAQFATTVFCICCCMFCFVCSSRKPNSSPAGLLCFE